MSYLGRFPLDCLKIDRAFVKDLPGSGIANGIAKSVAMLASACGLDSVAEGMETQDQVIALRVLGCQFAQGYYFSPPVPGEKIRELLRDGRGLPESAG
jgi:EAL domain-containing protein (putative c-di-GMP-specific phosphodiesterase class I)